MEQSKNNKPYFDNLRTLKEVDLNTFLNEFSILAEREYKGSYKDKFNYLKNCYCQEIFDILITEDFLNLYYLDRQAKHIKEKLNSNIDLSIFKTLIYCYNDSLREYTKEKEKELFEKKMIEEGFIKISNTQKELNGKKVLCYTDVLSIGLLDSNYKKMQIEGKLIYSDYHKALMIMPKGHSKTGRIIMDYAYIKEI